MWEWAGYARGGTAPDARAGRPINFKNARRTMQPDRPGLSRFQDTLDRHVSVMSMRPGGQRCLGAYDLEL